MQRREIRVALVGIGNCASALVQGVEFYSVHPTSSGLITPEVGQYDASSLRFVAAFDIDARKIGRPLSEAIYALPNNTMRFQDCHSCIDITVKMGPILDGVARHLDAHAEELRIVPASDPPSDVASDLVKAKVDVVICYLPVGSTEGVKYYAEAALAAGAAFVNCVPVFICRDQTLVQKFRAARIPLIGDDVRSQVGATITHQRLLELLAERGYVVSSTYQLNVGGNADFLNMLARERLSDKRKSKTDAVKAFLDEGISNHRVHVGPSDYVEQLRDTKVAYIRVSAAGFGGAPLNLEVRLEVEDSPNSAAVVLDAVRYAALAKDAQLGGPIAPLCSYYMKSPPERMADSAAARALAEIVIKASAARRSSN